MLLGPSGCGKTTALRMVAGLEDVTTGTIRIGDRVVNDVEPKDRDVAMVFQSYALYPHLTVAKNIEFPLRQRGVEKARAGPPGQADRREPGLGRTARPSARSALGWPAPTGGARPGHRALTPGVLDGRAALQPRRHAADPDPRRHRDPPGAARDDDAVRDPRPGRGDDDGRPHRGHERRRRSNRSRPPRRSTSRPANIFVAGFIGSPGMNLLTGKLDPTVGARVVRVETGIGPGAGPGRGQPGRRGGRGDADPRRCRSTRTAPSAPP